MRALPSLLGSVNPGFVGASVAASRWAWLGCRAAVASRLAILLGSMAARSLSFLSLLQAPLRLSFMGIGAPGDVKRDDHARGVQCWPSQPVGPDSFHTILRRSVFVMERSSSPARVEQLPDRAFCSPANMAAAALAWGIVPSPLIAFFGVALSWLGAH